MLIWGTDPNWTPARLDALKAPSAPVPPSHRPDRVRKCAWCGDDFIPQDGSAPCCSPYCGQRRRHANAPSATCTVCGKTFKQIRSSQTTCPGACRSERIKAERRAGLRPYGRRGR